MNQHVRTCPRENQLRIDARSLIALEDTLHAARQSTNPVRVLCEAMMRECGDEKVTTVIETLYAIWDAEPAPEGQPCPHFDAIGHLVSAAEDIAAEHELHGSRLRLRGKVHRAWGPATFIRRARA